MSGNHPTSIPFASGRLTADLGHELVFARDGGFRRLSPRRFAVLELLATRLGDTVPFDELIDATSEGLVSSSGRFRQRGNVGAYIQGLRGIFEELLPQAGDIKQGVLQTEYGKGFWLAEHWQQPELSTGVDDFLT